MLFVTRKLITVTALCMTALTASPILAAKDMTSNDASHVMIMPKDIKWTDGPVSLPKGSQVAILEGDPSKEGPFTIRLKVPANYQIAPHWHPNLEHVTVISGSFYMGLGDQLDKKQGKKLPTGSFMVIQPETHHFAFTTTPAIIQLHGIGPWKINYINPQDDPRNAKSST